MNKLTRTRFVLLLAIALQIPSVGMCQVQWNSTVDAQGNAVASYPGIVTEYIGARRVVSGLTATGTNAPGALDLSQRGAGIAVFSTVASGTGTALDSAIPVGGAQTIVNNGLFALSVYPSLASGGTINGGGSYSVASTTAVTFTQSASGTWLASAASGGGGSGSGSIPSTSAILCGSGTLNIAIGCTGLAGISSTGQVIYGNGINQALQGSTRGAASGVAPLDASSLVPLSNVPTIVPATASLLCGTAGIVNGAVACPSLVGISSAGAVTYGHATSQAIQGSDYGAASGVATLDGSGKVPTSQVPQELSSYVHCWASTETIAAANFQLGIIPWAGGGTIKQIQASCLSGTSSPSFVAQARKGNGVNVTSCSVTVTGCNTGSSSVVTACNDASTAVAQYSPVSINIAAGSLVGTNQSACVQLDVLHNIQ